MYPLDFLALQFDEAFSRPLSIRPLPLSPSLFPYLSSASREETGRVCTGFSDMKSAVDMDHDGSLLGPGKWRARVKWRRISSIKLNFGYFTLFSIVLREFHAKFGRLQLSSTDYYWIFRFDSWLSCFIFPWISTIFVSINFYVNYQISFTSAIFNF